jgi:hypothetical protein
MFGRTRNEFSIFKHFKRAYGPSTPTGQMDQVFLNIFINEAKGMPGGGNLDLETKNVF